MISHPSASRAFAFARTEKAVSVPRRSIRLASFTPSSARSSPGKPPHYTTLQYSSREQGTSDTVMRLQSLMRLIRAHSRHVPPVAYILRRCYRYVTQGV